MVTADHIEQVTAILN